MAINIAQKRARKTQKRKLVVAQKRQAEAIENSLPSRVLRAASAPIQFCLLSESLTEIGMGMLVLTRGASRDYMAMSSFLLDTCCLGIKDLMFDRIDGEAFEGYIDAINADAPMVDVDPAYARKLLRELATWSESIGFAPHRDFATVERIFGDVSADASDAAFQFGRDGKPVYIPGPDDSPHLIRQRVERLRKHLGDDGFEIAA